MGEKHFEEFEPERLVKSTDRVRDLGEVFTPSSIVDDMLDLLPEDIWTVHPSPSFLEPSVGNGNFVSAILSRKLTYVDDAFRLGSLPAGKNLESAEYHALEALSSIYGIDISEDNIIGGTPGHEVACRPRLLTIMRRWHENLPGFESRTQSDFIEAARWIVEHNMIIGNMLSRDADGLPTGRDEIVLMDYTWKAKEKTVAIAMTTLGAVISEAEEATSDVLSFFGNEPGVEIWNGSAHEIFKVDNYATLDLTGKRISNSRGGNK